MSLRRCGGNQDWLGSRDETATPADGCLRTLEVEWPARGGRGAMPAAERKALIIQALDLGARRFILRLTGSALADPGVLDLLRIVRGRGGKACLILSGRISRAAARELAVFGADVIWRWPAGRSWGSLKGAKNGRRPQGLSALMSAGYPGPGRGLGLRIPIHRFGLNKAESLWRGAMALGLIPSLERTWRDGASKARRSPRLPLMDAMALAARLEPGAPESPPPGFAARLGCDRVGASLAVTAGGDLKPCLGFAIRLGPAGGADLGRMIGEHALLAALRSPRNAIKGFCRICDSAAVCSGCRALACLRADDPLAADPECWEKTVPSGTVHAVDVGRRLPHKGEMLFVRGTARLDDKKIVLAMRFPKRNAFVRADGTAVPLALIEMLAQLCAAQRAHELKTADGGRVHGYLVGIDHVDFRRQVSAGDPLRLTVWNTLEMNEINRVEGDVFRDGERIAGAEMTLFKAETWFPEGESVGAAAAEPEGSRPAPGRWVTDRVGRGIFEAMRRLDIGPDGSLRADLLFGPDFVGFNGHFPGHPVVPGVVLVYAGLLLAEAGLGRELAFRSLKRARFMKPVRPSAPVEFQVRRSGGEGKPAVLITGKVFLDGEPAAKFEIEAAEAGGKRP